MTSRNKVIFQVGAGTGRVRLVTVHPKKEWVAVITSSNTFSLWNYKQKMLIKSFNSSTLDDAKNFEVREMVFFDRHSLPYPSALPMRANLIFLSPTRIYLYDYLTDAIKQINEKDIETKTIRRVCVYSESRICVSLGDGSFKVLDSRDLYSKNTMTIRNIRGYHTKPINWLIAYTQSANDMPRVITVSNDGLMACWNVDALLHAPAVPDPATPSFKFLMPKGTRNDSNNGEEIISLHYDSASYRLLTLTDSYITIWSTMTGIELRRLKNNKYREVAVCNHFSFGGNCFLVHTARAELLLLRQTPNDTEVEVCVDLRPYLKEGDTSIVSLKTLPQNPNEVFLCTQASLFVIEVNTFYRPSYGFHPAFTTRLTTLNSREFVIKSEGAIRGDIVRGAVQGMKFEEDILFNSFFLSFEGGAVQFNLMEIQFENMLHEQRKYRLLKLPPDSPLAKPTSTQSLIDVRFDATQFFIFNRDLTYFEIYAVDQEGGLLSLHDQPQPLDFHSRLVQVAKGCARDVVWHQFKQQFAAIKGAEKTGKFVEYVVEKKGLFGKNETTRLSGEPATWHACIFERSKHSGQYELVVKSEPLNTKLFRLFSFGALFGYSADHAGTELVAFLHDEKAATKEVEGAAVWPERVFVSYCETYQIYAYDGHFIVLRTGESGQVAYLRSVQETIYEGMFWEKFFFFSTKTAIFFLQVGSSDVTVIKVGDSTSTVEERRFEAGWDDLEDGDNRIPEGQLQFLSIVNYHLLMLNYSGQIALLPLKPFPYIEFCIDVVLGNTDRLQQIFSNANHNLQSAMRDTLQAYGVVLPSV